MIPWLFNPELLQFYCCIPVPDFTSLLLSAKIEDDNAHGLIFRKKLPMFDMPARPLNIRFTTRYFSQVFVSKWLDVAPGGKYPLSPDCLFKQPNHCSYNVGPQKCPLNHPKLNIKIALWPIPIIALSVKILLKPSQQDGSCKNCSIFPKFWRVLEYVPV